jgi:hypothetical protein
MPFTQKAPFDAGWVGFGEILVTTPFSVVKSEPQSVPHSQQVLG